jgi:hypothetical protein
MLHRVLSNSAMSALQCRVKKAFVCPALSFDSGSTTHPQHHDGIEIPAFGTAGFGTSRRPYYAQQPRVLALWLLIYRPFSLPTPFSARLPTPPDDVEQEPFLPDLPERRGTFYTLDQVPDQINPLGNGLAREPHSMGQGFGGMV